MVNWVLWFQAFAALLTGIVALGTVFTGLYSTVRGTPQFLSRITGVNGLERRLESVDGKAGQILDDVEKMQDLQYQQAQSYNDLKETVCEELDIPPDERPDSLDTLKIRREVLDDDRTDFTRGASGWSSKVEED